jgi:sugar lactone lactonase YvrE
MAGKEVRSMKVLAAVVLALGLAGAAAAQEAADPALRARLERYERLYAESRNPSVLWLMAESYAEAGDKARALDALDRVAELNMGFMPIQDSRVARYAGDPRYEAIAARMRADQQVVDRARVAWILARPELTPEGIAYHAASRRLFIGDATARRVLSVGAEGKAVDFAKLELQPLGMAVDARGGRLWVATSSAFFDDANKASALVALDLRTGAVLARVTSAEAQSFNDLALAPNGDLWATDSLGGQVFRMKAGAQALERITPQGGMAYPNGIAVSDDGRHVFVAQGASLRRITAETGEVTALEHPERLTTLGIDGLYWIGGELVAVQNGGTAGRVLRLELSPARDAITAFEVLAAGVPQFDVPTTGAPNGSRLFVLANAQLNRPVRKPFVILDVPVQPNA